MTHAECRVHDEDGALLASFTVDAMVRGFARRRHRCGRQDGAVSLTSGPGPSALARPALQRTGARGRRVRRAVPPPGAGRGGRPDGRRQRAGAAGPPPGRAAALRLPGRRRARRRRRARARCAGHVRVPWGAVEAWYEEDERVFFHPRNPYHRVDCVRTSRRLRVEGWGPSWSTRPRPSGVYETALEPRLYVGRDQVRMDLLVASPTRRRTAPTRARRRTGPRSSATPRWPTSPGRTTTRCPNPSPIQGLLSFDPARATRVVPTPPRRHDLSRYLSRPLPGCQGVKSPPQMVSLIWLCAGPPM